MLKLYNTLTRKKEEFRPLNPPAVGLYTCGPTVYNFAHIGNLRTYIFEDILKRTLIADGFKVRHVMNITDVGHLTSDADEGEDKMEKGAKREGKSVWDIAEFYTAAFKEDMHRLNLLEPDVWCKATDHIKEQIELIQQLEKKGFTYQINDGIYFDTSKDPHYGKLARLDKEGLKAGARVEMAKGKRNPTDFALWKFSVPRTHPVPRGGTPLSRGDSPPGEGPPKAGVGKRQMEWPSPWGVGFPGWHIECSAMAMKYLGVTFDVHCGGIDHVPVHHTNEIAQSENATEKQFAKTWMHGEFLLVNEGRMGKSEGNFLILQALVDKGYDPLAYRYFTFTAHYRQKLNFSWEALDAAQTAFRKLRDLVAQWNTGETPPPPPPSSPLLGGGTMTLKLTNSLPKKGEKEREGVGIGCAEYEQRFLDAVNDDLNIPQALSVVWDLAKSDYPPTAKKASLLKFDEILGLRLVEAKKEELAIPPEVQKLIKEREQARAAKDWKKADELRAQIQKQGFSVEDTSEGPSLKTTAVQKR